MQPVREPQTAGDDVRAGRGLCAEQRADELVVRHVGPVEEEHEGRRRRRQRRRARCLDRRLRRPVDHDDVDVCCGDRRRLGARAQREHLVPPPHGHRGVECGSRRTRCRVESPTEGGLDAVARRLEQNAAAVCRRDQLRHAAHIAGDEGHPELEALVDRVRRVVEERGHDRDRSRPLETCERFVLIEARVERDASQCLFRSVRQQALDARDRPRRGRLAEELELDVFEQLRLEGVQAGGERLEAFLLVEPAEECKPFNTSVDCVRRLLPGLTGGTRARDVRNHVCLLW